MTDRRTSDPRAWAIMGAAGLAAFLYSNFILDVLLSGPGELLAVVSDLEAPGMPNATVLRVAEVVCAVLVLSLLPPLRRALSGSRATTVAIWATAAFAVLNALAGLVPLPCPSSRSAECQSTADNVQRWAHDGFSVASTVALFVGVLAVLVEARRNGPGWLVGWSRVIFWVGGVLGTAAFLFSSAIDLTSWETGVAQRLQLVAMSVWIVCLGVAASRAPTHQGRAPAPPVAGGSDA
jgi:Protein of unknown function (DUF998)